MASQLSNVNSSYVLGYTDKEHQRLMRQAALIAPITERLFREAGVGSGQRVLDLGSGLGDVSMLIARLVGPSGQVVGVEQDTNSISFAKARVAEAGFANVTFTQSDVTNLAAAEPFDAVVGRFILMFLPDPAGVVKAACRLVRPGGVLAFQEPSWVPMLAMAKRLPLWFKMLSSIQETFLRCGANSELGLDLHRLFQDAGLPAPNMHLDMPLGDDISLISVMTDLFASVRPIGQQKGVRFEELGDLNTLSARIHAEIGSEKTVVSVVPLVSVWSRKPSAI